MKLLKRFLKEAAKLFTLLLIIVVALNLYTMWHLRQITSVSAYEKVKNKRWTRDDLVAHFPEIIPRDAENPRFFYRPGYLQPVV